jgi:hypothetical protein
VSDSPDDIPEIEASDLEGPVVDSYTLMFEDEDRARLYVKRIAHYLHDVAMYIDASCVIVLDGLGIQREPILRLARESGARRLVTQDVLALTMAGPVDTKKE